jgi:hypothetical protein
MSLFGKCIRHERNKDVCYIVLGCMDMGTKFKLKVIVVNMGYVTSWRLLNQNLDITIDAKDITKWHNCLDADAKCLRYAEWKRISEGHQ